MDAPRPVSIVKKSLSNALAIDCVCALDGTHIRVKVSNIDVPKYRGRKDWPATNVLAACSFDLKFTYILSGWEGTASDSRIIKNALSRHDKLLIPHGAATAAERNVEIIQEEEMDLDSSPFVKGLKKRKIASVDAYGSKKSSALDLSIKEVVVAIDHLNSVIKNKSFRENKEKMMLVIGCPVEKRLALLKMFSF
ncbi:hypothetical protein ZIOFF_026501 [Zingiber officinale]|uniref:DDE Tnp4 domain-containing protein n=1 Tax=Zingiber officinale TaxID=94328 RepID=A0A8J5HEE0_ZINOF|nr:hypothetical protein ZIOFF_026501 [Zingiber officinale]